MVDAFVTKGYDIFNSLSLEFLMGVKWFYLIVFQYLRFKISKDWYLIFNTIICDTLSLEQVEGFLETVKY
jgi:hypothetical protein